MDKKSKETIVEAIYFLLNLRFMSNYNRIKKLEEEKIISEESNKPEHPMKRTRTIEEIDLNKYNYRDIFFKEYEEKGLEVLNDSSEVYNKEFDKHLINLNSLLDKKDKVKEVLDIEQQMKKIQAKKYISVKEFKEIYGYSPEWQKNRRSRIHNSLPYIQTVSGGKITYDVKEVENWFKNENITI